MVFASLTDRRIRLSRPRSRLAVGGRHALLSRVSADFMIGGGLWLALTSIA